jgi:hypothetical protein
MGRKWYGSLNNRVDENKMYCDKIEVGTGMTEYSWSDRHAYEVTAVKDQKHVTVREYDHKHVGEEYTNNWELISNPENPELNITKRGNYWYWTVTVTADDVRAIMNEQDADKRINGQLWLCHNDIDSTKVLEKGKVTKYHRANVSFGVADYYYDYEF